MGLAHVAAKHLREGACRPRMARSILPVCVARNDSEWTVYRHRDHLLSVGMDNDWSADPAIPLKALAIQPLARARPFQLGEARIRRRSISVLYGGRLNLCHSGRIRIRLRRYVVSVSLRLTDHLEHHRRFGEGRAIDVDHM